MCYKKKSVLKACLNTKCGFGTVRKAGPGIPSSGQCCGSETIYSGSGTDLGKVPGLYSDPDPCHIWHTI
jgi:hypothetical protein